MHMVKRWRGAYASITKSGRSSLRAVACVSQDVRQRRDISFQSLFGNVSSATSLRNDMQSSLHRSSRNRISNVFGNVPVRNLACFAHSVSLGLCTQQKNSCMSRFDQKTGLPMENLSFVAFVIKNLRFFTVVVTFVVKNLRFSHSSLKYLKNYKPLRIL